jgi:hypothetical protein
MNVHIRHNHEELLESLRYGKLPRNLTWSAVVDLIGKIGEVQAHGNDEFSFIVGSQKQLFKKPSTHDLGMDEISRLRAFLKDAEVSEKPLERVQPGRMVVVVDHHAAHIYYDLGESVPKDEVTAKPYDPFGFHHHLIHRKEAHYKGGTRSGRELLLRGNLKGYPPCAVNHPYRSRSGKEQCGRVSERVLENPSPGNFSADHCFRNGGSLCNHGAANRRDCPKAPSHVTHRLGLNDRAPFYRRV